MSHVTHTFVGRNSFNHLVESYAGVMSHARKSHDTCHDKYDINRTLIIVNDSCRIHERPPAPMNHVKYLRASPTEMPFQNWYTANTNHFHLTDSVRRKSTRQLY